jgi:hypothetical protein
MHIVTIRMASKIQVQILKAKGEGRQRRNHKMILNQMKRIW